MRKAEPVFKVGLHPADGLPKQLLPVSRLPSEGVPITSDNLVVGRVAGDGTPEFYSDENLNSLDGLGPDTTFKAMTDGRGTVLVVFAS